MNYRKLYIYGILVSFVFLLGATKCQETQVDAAEEQDVLLCVYNLETGWWGYIDTEGNLLFEGDWDIAGDFTNGFARVLKDEKYGFINKKGEYLVEPVYESLSNFSDGMAAFERDGKYGFINTEGEEQIPPKFKSVFWGFSEGLAVVSQGKDDGYIDNQGNLVLDFQFNSAGSFSEGIALVKKNSSPYYYINRQGEPLFNNRSWFYMSNFSEGLAAVMTKEYDGWYINKQGEEVLSMRNLVLGSFEDGHAIVIVPHEMIFYGLINKKGEFVLPPEYNRLYYCGHGIYITYDMAKKRYIFIDLTGKQKYGIEFHEIYNAALPFKNGWMRVRPAEDILFYDENGNRMEVIWLSVDGRILNYYYTN